MLILSPTSLSFPIQFQSLLQLLTLVAILKAGIAMPRNPVCPNTEDKNFPQSVRVKLNILNRNMNSRRPSDYYNRSTSPWSLRYVKAPDKISLFFLVCIRLPVKSPWGKFYSFRIISQTWKGHGAKQWLSNFRSMNLFDRAQDIPTPNTYPVRSPCHWHQNPTQINGDHRAYIYDTQVCCLNPRR